MSSAFDKFNFLNSIQVYQCKPAGMIVRSLNSVPVHKSHYIVPAQSADRNFICPNSVPQKADPCFILNCIGHRYKRQSLDLAFCHN